MKQKFILCGGGDNSVGIPDIEAEITVEDNLNRDGIEIMDFNIDWKTFLSEYYDVPIKNVLTEEEDNKEWEEIINEGLEYGESCL